MPGQIVYHPRHGRGTAMLQRKSGMELQVRFENGNNFWVRADELEVFDVAKPEAVPTVKPEEKRKEQTDRIPINFVQRKIVEALRLGIVPDEGFQLFTVGRQSEIDELTNWLANDGDGSHLLIGPYGTGKTHLLNHFRLLALDAGYAVSLVEMDPQETPFSKPKRVYSQIIRNLQWRDGSQTRDFKALLKRVLNRGYLSDHKYFTHLRRAADADTHFWDWINGAEDIARPFSEQYEFKHLPGLFPYTTAANIYCYLLSGLSWGCQRKGIDLKGLLVLFDESEALHAARGQLARERGVNFLDTLNVTASNHSQMLKPAYESDYEYSGHAREIPFLYKSPCGLKLLFAFTSVTDVYLAPTLQAVPYIELDTLSAAKFKQVLKRIGGVYNAAYHARTDKADPEMAISLIQNLDFSSTREMVKSYIEALDISRFGTYADDDDGW